MKAGVLAIAAAVATGASAASHGARRHAHEAFHLERGLLLTTGAAPEPTCGCTTIYTTITGEGVLYSPPPPATTSTPAPAPTTTKATVVVVPTPLATVCPTPGIYTFPATTITLTESTTVCAATSTHVPSGTHVYGGVTTVVETATTVVCPYATVSTFEGVVTSTILTTTYVCPSAGTYTIAPETTVVSVDTVLVYPTPASYAPGTYTQPEVVTTITETDYVVFCPFTSPAPAPVPEPTYVAPEPVKTTDAPAPVKTTEAPAPVKTTEAPAPVKTTETPIVKAASYTALAPPKASPSKSASGGYAGGSLGNTGNQWAITYTPYDEAGLCKTKDAVAADIATIAGKGFKTVRVYSTDCSGLINIGPACEASGLKMIIGVFINESGTSGAQQQVTDIISWGKFGIVELIVVGNEAIHSGFVSAGDLAGFVSSCKSAFKGAGYTGPVTTTEPLNVWEANASTLCGPVDVVGANIHPFFNSGVKPSEAGSFTKSQLAIVDGLCPGKSGINLETGWPSGGQCNGLACPGTTEQAIAIKSIIEAVGGKSVMFSFKDDRWKKPGAFLCEQHWGAIHIF